METSSVDKQVGPLSRGHAIQQPLDPEPVREMAPFGIRFSKLPRSSAVHLFIAMLGVALCIRLICLQVIASRTFASRALRQQMSEEVILARPGDIVDRNQRLLATTITVPSLYANPKLIPLEERLLLASRLGAALNMSSESLLQKFEGEPQRQFVWIKRRLTDREADAIRELGLPSRYIGTRREFQRVYPQGTLAAHLLGLRNIDGQGRGGIEEFFDDQLKGIDGRRRFVRDARGYVLDILDEVMEPPQHGTALTLTIDIVLQLHVERQLDELMQRHQAKGACAIAIDPATGDVLALASRPTFDPNRPERAAPEDWRNMVTSATFEPGSTFKPFVAAYGLHLGLLNTNDQFDCENGVYRMGKRLLHDHHPYGLLSLTDVLVKSSNIGMAKIGERLGNVRLHQLAQAFGFGSKTGIELPGEVTGFLRPEKEWTRYSTGSIPMGHELTATPLQMATAYAILANHGRRISPHLLLRTGKEGPRSIPVISSPILHPEAADWMVTGPLVEVVQRGTGRQAFRPELQIFGKTGTAQKTDAATGVYVNDRHFSSFVGGAPADRPKLIVLVSVDEPQGHDQFGGSVAAPYVAEILKAGIPILQAQE